eukprot:821532-Prymnesium_polylepis.1
MNSLGPGTSGGIGGGRGSAGGTGGKLQSCPAADTPTPAQVYAHSEAIVALWAMGGANGTGHPPINSAVVTSVTVIWHNATIPPTRDAPAGTARTHSDGTRHAPTDDHAPLISAHPVLSPLLTVADAGGGGAWSGADNGGCRGQKLPGVENAHLLFPQHQTPPPRPEQSCFAWTCAHNRRRCAPRNLTGRRDGAPLSESGHLPTGGDRFHQMRSLPAGSDEPARAPTSARGRRRNC